MAKFQIGQRVRHRNSPVKGTITLIYPVAGQELVYEINTECNKQLFEESDLVAVLSPDPTIDLVNHPSHYTNSPGGIECIQVTRHRNFNIGNAIKYLWRQGLKDEVGKDKIIKQIEDLKKAIWYINDEIDRITPWDLETFSKESTL